MNERDKSLAEAVLRRLCEGAQVDGIRFGPVPQVLITDHESSKTPIKGQVFLNLASSWSIFDRLPERLPASEGDFPDVSDDEAIATICSLREQTISHVRLAEEMPHLILELESGRVLFLNGHHDAYECWQLGVAHGDPAESWLVVACPGDAIAVWAPKEFLRSEPAA